MDKNEAIREEAERHEKAMSTIKAIPNYLWGQVDYVSVVDSDIRLEYMDTWEIAQQELRGWVSHFGGYKVSSYRLFGNSYLEVTVKFKSINIEVVVRDGKSALHVLSGGKCQIESTSQTSWEVVCSPS